MRFSKEQQIIHHLMLKSFDIKDIGLFNGRMGLVIFFFHYAKYKNNPVYEDLAGDLLDESLEDMHKELPLTFASGLSGIAWGLEYLVQNNFVEGDSNEICEELDKKIISIDPKRFEDYSIDTGLEGIIHYVLARINGAAKQNNPCPFDSLYMNDLIHTFTIIFDKKKSIELTSLFKLLTSYTKRKESFEYNFNLKNIIENKPLKSNKNIFLAPLGIKNGLSGLLLNQII